MSLKIIIRRVWCIFMFLGLLQLEKNDSSLYFYNSIKLFQVCNKKGYFDYPSRHLTNSVKTLTRYIQVTNRIACCSCYTMTTSTNTLYISYPSSSSCGGTTEWCYSSREIMSFRCEYQMGVSWS